ncbi:formate transporter FocA [Kineosporia succinea]
MALKAVAVGVAKAGSPPLTTFVLAVLAGGFIAFGALFATIASSTAPGSVGLPYGVTKVFMGLAFSVGLILVVVGGAELFTSNVLLVMAWAQGRISGARVLRNWAIVYAGNLAGAVSVAGLVAVSGEYRSGGGGVGLAALKIAEGKGELGFGEALVLGVLCNVLVCLAVWLTYSARTTADRIMAVIPPVTAFVAAGFEHSVANMFFLPVATLVKALAPESFWTSIGAGPEQFAHVSWTAFAHNLLPVTIGNLVGGAVIVGGLYGLAYLRPTRSAGADPHIRPRTAHPTTASVRRPSHPATASTIRTRPGPFSARSTPA